MAGRSSRPCSSWKRRDGGAGPHWHCRWGELDLVLERQQQLLVVEVKGRRADQSACDLSNALKHQWNVQMDGVSRRLEKLEKRRRYPL